MGEPVRDLDALSGLGDPSPIDLPGRDPGVLAIHGFGGTPVEVALVTEVAASLGLRAHAPLLPGHGTNARDLARTRFADWSQAAEHALNQVAKPTAPAIVVGLSLGALLAIHLAATRPNDVRALVLLANAIRLASPFPDWPLRFIDRFKIPDFSLPKAGADISDPAARKTHLTYGTQPVHSAIEVLRAGERVEQLLGSIRCPTLIVHGRRDHVCPVTNAHRVAGKINTADQRIVILPRSFHIITRDVEQEVVRSELVMFFQRFADGASMRG